MQNKKNSRISLGLIQLWRNYNLGTYYSFDFEKRNNNVCLYQFRNRNIFLTNPIFKHFCKNCILTVRKGFHLNKNVDKLAAHINIFKTALLLTHKRIFHQLGTLCLICLRSFAFLWCKMPMFWRAGMREGVKPLPLAFQYLIFMV